MTEATERPPKLWVEHVMPQNWHENWPLNGELVDPQPFAGLFGSDVSGYSERQTAIQTLGNLTITTDRLNQSMGQAPFSEKALKLVEHSNLTLNKRIVEYDAWDETSIRERGENLAKLAVALWPSPFQA